MKIQIEIRICEAYDLKYFAAYGTLLDAARREGLIPWNEDIDLWTPVKDYLAFQKACADGLGPSFHYQSHETNADNFITRQRIGARETTSMPKDLIDIKAEWGVCINIFY